MEMIEDFTEKDMQRSVPQCGRRTYHFHCLMFLSRFSSKISLDQYPVIVLGRNLYCVCLILQGNIGSSSVS
jgi:hypothetical protein